MHTPPSQFRHRNIAAPNNRLSLEIERQGGITQQVCDGTGQFGQFEPEFPKFLEFLRSVRLSTIERWKIEARLLADREQHGGTNWLQM